MNEEVHALKKQHGLVRFLNASKDAGTLDDISREIERAISRFSVRHPICLSFIFGLMRNFVTI